MREFLEYLVVAPGISWIAAVEHYALQFPLETEAGRYNHRSLKLKVRVEIYSRPPHAQELVRLRTLVETKGEHIIIVTGVNLNKMPVATDAEPDAWKTPGMEVFPSFGPGMGESSREVLRQVDNAVSLCYTPWTGSEARLVVTHKRRFGISGPKILHNPGPDVWSMAEFIEPPEKAYPVGYRYEGPIRNISYTLSQEVIDSIRQEALLDVLPDDVFRKYFPDFDGVRGIKGHPDPPGPPGPAVTLTRDDQTRAALLESLRHVEYEHYAQAVNTFLKARDAGGEAWDRVLEAAARIFKEPTDSVGGEDEAGS